jgi:NAD-dependent dihydropyrimidine dehydrogenase PreA subunit
MVLRKIVHIDEEKCMGCGQCIPQCAEGALRLINGKAKLVSEIYCDGLGACLGKCPVGAITIDEREATAFDDDEARRHLVKGTIPQGGDQDLASETVSKLSNWPIQLTLVPPSAPFLRVAEELMVVADCVPFAYAGFHSDLLNGRPLIIGCPKLDNQGLYRDRLAEAFRINNITEVTVVNMEVPCCFGLLHLVRQAIASSGKNILLDQRVVTVKGELATQMPQVSTPRL